VDHDGAVSGACVPESVVELGARVVDRSGRCVAPEGADRRVLTDAMFDALTDGRGEMVGERPSLRLTLGTVPEALLRDRYPHLGRLHDRARLPGGDVRVVPIAHYQLGGFLVDGSGATAVPGLFLAGEMTGGLHGRNRLMGNGITEAVVDGRCAGEAAVRFLGELSSPGR
jgi:succinate dehydrogenase / fumarate reductase flavoprotein subunit/L-aspartate oxidase